MRPSRCAPRWVVASCPRSVVGAVGDVERARAAQSSGLWPGASITFLLGRLEGAWVDVLGAREGCMFVVARAFCAGTRRVLAGEGRDAGLLLLLLLKLGGAASLPWGRPGRRGGAREAVAGFRRGGLRARDGGREEGGGIVARWRA